MTFTVNPSPTKTATRGTLQVVATVAPGLDGAAAIQDGFQDPSTSVVPSGHPGPGPSPSPGQGGLQTGNYADTPRITGSDGKVTEVFKVIDGTTILEVYAPTASSVVVPSGRDAVALGDTDGRGGSWLEAVPMHQQRKKVSRQILSNEDR